MVRANGCVELQYSTPASRHCGYTANTDRCQTNRAWLNVHLSESPVWTTDCKCFHGHLGTFTPAAAAVVGLASPCGTVSYRQCQRRCVFAFINAPFWLRASSSQIPSSVYTDVRWMGLGRYAPNPRLRFRLILDQLITWVFCIYKATS